MRFNAAKLNGCAQFLSDCDGMKKGHGISQSKCIPSGSRLHGSFMPKSAKLAAPTKVSPPIRANVLQMKSSPVAQMVVMCMYEQPGSCCPNQRKQVKYLKIYKY